MPAGWSPFKGTREQRRKCLQVLLLEQRARVQFGSQWPHLVITPRNFVCQKYATHCWSHLGFNKAYDPKSFKSVTQMRCPMHLIRELKSHQRLILWPSLSSLPSPSPPFVAEAVSCIVGEAVSQGNCRAEMGGPVCVLVRRDTSICTHIPIYIYNATEEAELLGSLMGVLLSAWRTKSWRRSWAEDSLWVSF